MKIGFIGLGRMGAAMAANLHRAGHELTLYNRTPDKARALAGDRAHIAESVAEACRGQDAVVTMLANDEAVEGVTLGADGIVAHLPPGSLHIASSTIGIALAERLAASHAKSGQRMVSAPVFGRPEAAAAAKLFVVAAGDPGAVRDAGPIFDAIGQRTFVMGETPPTANLVKLSGNFLIASVIESLAEALALVGKGGGDQHAFLELLTSTLFPAPVYRTYGTLLVEEKFAPPGFAAPLGLKDVGLALAAGEQLRVPLPLASLLRDRFITLLAQGGDGLDWSAIGRLAAQDAGKSS